MTKRRWIVCILIGALFVILIGAAVLFCHHRPGSIPVLPARMELLSSGSQPTEPLNPEGEIVLISRHVNYAWGYDDSGAFVDSAGNVYPFDFHAQYGGLSAGSNRFERLELLRHWVNPSARIDPSEMQKFIDSAHKIRNREDYREEEKMYDYGERQLIFRDPDTGEELLLGEWGDVDRTLTDPNAPDAITKGRSIEQAAEQTRVNAPVFRVYMPEDVPFLELPAQNGANGRYFVRYASQLKLLSDEIGVPLDGIKLDEYEKERYHFFVDLQAVGTPVAILCRGGEISILTEGESEPHCIIAAFPKEAFQIPAEGCQDLFGKSWTVYKNGDPAYDANVHKGLSYGVSNDRMQSVWEDYDMNGLRGVCLRSAADYERFLQSCDANELMEDTTPVRSLIEADFTPDFRKYALCVRIARRDEGTTFGWDMLQIGDGWVLTGLVSDPPRDNNQSGPYTDGVIAWVWIPKTYLIAGNDYSVW